MRYVMLWLAMAMPCWSQTTTTGQADTKGPCSPAVTGSNNQFTITCQGISDKLGTQLIGLLNRVAKNQTDAEAMMSKLDGCLQGVKDLREQQVPWRLTEGQKSELKRLLAGVTSKADIHVIGPERNAALLGRDLYAVLKDSGWTVDFTTDFSLSESLVGVSLLVNHQDFPAAITLLSALKDVGILAQAVLDAKEIRATKKDTIYIAVGAKPSAPVVNPAQK